MADGYISSVTLPDNTTYNIYAKAADITSTANALAYYSSTTGTFASLGNGTSGQYLKSNGTAAPSWASFPSTWTPSSHSHGNISNTGTLANTNRLMWTKDSLAYAGYHYASATAVAINSTAAPSQNFYVSGSAQFNMGTSDGSSQKNFVLYGNSRFLSFGGQGIQAYSGAVTSTTPNTLYLQYNGGDLSIGGGTAVPTLTFKATTANISWTTASITGTFDFKSANGFTYSGIGAASDNVARTIWFSYNGIQGRPVYDNDFKYNPSTNTITIGTGTLSATNYSGIAAKATAANVTSTTNAVAYYTNTTGTFGSKASANGALYATTANGTLSWGTLPIAQGGTGKTTAADAWTALGGGASGKHADSYFVKAVSSTDNAIVRFDSTAGQVQNSGVTIDDDNNITTSGSYIENKGSRIQQVNLLPGGAWSNYAANTWYRCCKIDSKNGSYANFIIQLGGTWSTGAPTMATISVQSLNVNMTLLQCTRVGNIKSMRIVNNDGLWLDVQLNIQSSGSLGIPVATFIGNVVISNINTTITTTTDETAASIINFTTNYCDNDTYKLNNKISISSTAASTSTSTGALLVSGGAGIGGRVSAKEFSASQKMVISAGKVYSNISGSNAQLPAKTSMLFSDGLAIANPGISTSANDVGWIRVTGTSESDMALEIATGDDGGTSTGERIVARQYNTSNTVVKEVVLLEKQTGASTFPTSIAAPTIMSTTLSVTGAITGLTFNGLTLTNATTNFSIANSSVTATFQETSGTVAYLSDVVASQIEIIRL